MSASPAMPRTAGPLVEPDATTIKPNDTRPAHPKLHYRPEIDGLRAFAVVPVILFHLGVPGFRGGSLGVDVFFVISGFLIMSIVRRETDAGTFSFTQFWARRVRRIMPAMIAVSAVTLLMTFFFVYRPEQASIGRQGSWAVLSGANLYFWKFVGNYWGTAASESPFLHMWSLAVEEQFYLFMPVAVWLIHKVMPRQLLAVMLAVIVLSFAAFIGLSRRNPEAAFYLLPTRAWELAAGCALAVIAPKGDGRWRSVAGTVGLVLLVASYFVINAFGVGMILPVTATLLVLAFARDGLSHRLLANRVSVGIGKVSYSLYLWHWPVIVFPLYLGLHVSVYASLAATAVLSVASYFLIEKPTRQARYTVPVSLACLLVTAAAAIGMARSNRVYDTSAFSTPDVYIRAYDCNPTAPPMDSTWTGLNVLPALAGPKTHADGGVRVGDGDPQVVLLGDSHGTFWAPTVRDAVTHANVPAALWVMGGVDPFFSVPAVKRTTPWYVSQAAVLEYDQARIRMLEKWKPRVVIVAARWSVKSTKTVKPFVDYLCRHADKVLLIEQPPELTIGNRNALQHLCFEGVRPVEGTRQYAKAGNSEDVQRGRDMIRAMAKAHANCDVVPVFDLFDRPAETLVLNGRDCLYMDDDHLTYQGSSLALGRIEQAVTNALARP